MQRPRMVESKDLLDWEAEGLTTAEMQTRLADEGKTVSIERKLRNSGRPETGDAISQSGYYNRICKLVKIGWESGRVSALLQGVDAI